MIILTILNIWHLGFFALKKLGILPFTYEFCWKMNCFLPHTLNINSFCSPAFLAFVERWWEFSWRCLLKTCQVIKKFWNMVGNEKLSPFSKQKNDLKNFCSLWLVPRNRPLLPPATSKTKSLEMNFHGRVAVCVLNLPSKDWHFIFTIADPQSILFLYSELEKTRA